MFNGAIVSNLEAMLVRVNHSNLPIFLQRAYNIEPAKIIILLNIMQDILIFDNWNNIAMEFLILFGVFRFLSLDYEPLLRRGEQDHRAVVIYMKCGWRIIVAVDFVRQLENGFIGAYHQHLVFGLNVGAPVANLNIKYIDHKTVTSLNGDVKFCFLELILVKFQPFHLVELIVQGISRCVSQIQDSGVGWVFNFTQFHLILVFQKFEYEKLGLTITD